LEEEYPKPNNKGWEEQYRYAKAFEDAAASIVQNLVAMRANYIELTKREKDETVSDLET
jgi:hypothetical protein